MIDERRLSCNQIEIDYPKRSWRWQNMASIREASVDGSTSELTMNARDRREMEGKKASKRWRHGSRQTENVRKILCFALRVLFFCVCNN